MDLIRRACVYQQRRVQSHASNSDSCAFFNLLTGPELLAQIESMLPEHRERLFPPTETLSMFLLYLLKALHPCNPGSWRRRSVPIALARKR
jgi:hypothetical protein